jgi:hypothetical protein
MSITIYLGPIAIPILITVLIWLIIFVRNCCFPPERSNAMVALFDIGWEVTATILTLITWLLYFVFT